MIEPGWGARKSDSESVFFVAVLCGLPMRGDEEEEKGLLSRRHKSAEMGFCSLLGGQSCLSSICQVRGEKEIMHMVLYA